MGLTRIDTFAALSIPSILLRILRRILSLSKYNPEPFDSFSLAQGCERPKGVEPQTSTFRSGKESNGLISANTSSTSYKC